VQERRASRRPYPQPCCRRYRRGRLPFLSLQPSAAKRSL